MGRGWPRSPDVLEEDTCEATTAASAHDAMRRFQARQVCGDTRGRNRVATGTNRVELARRWRRHRIAQTLSWLAVGTHDQGINALRRFVPNPYAQMRWNPWHRRLGCRSPLLRRENSDACRPAIHALHRASLTPPATAIPSAPCHHRTGDWSRTGSRTGEGTSILPGTAPATDGHMRGRRPPRAVLKRPGDDRRLATPRRR